MHARAPETPKDWAWTFVAWTAFLGLGALVGALRGMPFEAGRTLWLWLGFWLVFAAWCAVKLGARALERALRRR